MTALSFIYPVEIAQHCLMPSVTGVMQVQLSRQPIAVFKLLNFT